MRKTKQTRKPRKVAKKTRKPRKVTSKQALKIGRDVHAAVFDGRKVAGQSREVTEKLFQGHPMAPSNVDSEEEVIAFTMPKKWVQRISYGFSDLLCWSEGFKAGVRSIDEYGNNLSPFHQGIRSVRDIQDILKRLLEK